MKFAFIEVERDARGEWRWRGLAVNGKPLADSGQGYNDPRKVKKIFTKYGTGDVPLRVKTESKVVWPEFV